MDPQPSPQRAAPGSGTALSTALLELSGRLDLLLRHLAGAALRRRVEVDDLVQETYLRLLASEHAERALADGPAALWALARTVARHTVIDVARAARSAKRDAILQPLAPADWSRTSLAKSACEPSAESPGPHTLAVGAESARAMARAFESLAPEHRRVIGLRQIEGLSARETAARMGRSESAVHSLFRRALGALSSALEPNAG